MRHRRGPLKRRALALAGVLSVATLTLSGCGSSDDNSSSTADTVATKATESSGSSEPSTPSSGSESSSSAPASTTPSTTDTASQSPTPTSHDNSRPSRAKAAQVPADQMPGLNASWTWDTARGHRGPLPVTAGSSRCARGSLTAIGGVTEYSTTYTRSDVSGDSAILTTAVFPDEHTAQLASSVLDTWLAKCQAWVAKQPHVDRVKVTGDSTVSTSVGTGHQRLVSYGPVQGDPDSTYFNGEGYVRDGDVMSYLVFHSVGQDYDYPAGKEPVDLGLAVAADWLVKSR